MEALFCIFDWGQHFDFKKLSTLFVGSSLKEVTFLSQTSTFSRNLNKWLVSKLLKAKAKFSDNRGHNILEDCNILVDI